MYPFDFVRLVVVVVVVVAPRAASGETGKDEEEIWTRKGKSR